jgi:Ran GTPase-activating protein (RanGAP) involved in mRNA processing and transport
MLRSTSKTFKGVVDKLRLPAVIRLSSSFWKDTRNGTAAEKLQFVMRQLTTLSTWCLITTLELPSCNIEGQDAERLAGVLAQCPTLAHFNLSAGYCASRANRIGAAGAERLAEVLARCRSLAHLDLMGNHIGDAGAESIAGVLAQCRVLTHLNLSIALGSVNMYNHSVDNRSKEG